MFRTDRWPISERIFFYPLRVVVVHTAVEEIHFHPMGRWLAFQRVPLLFVAKGCNAECAFPSGAYCGVGRMSARMFRRIDLHVSTHFGGCSGIVLPGLHRHLYWRFSFRTAALQLHSIKRAFAVYRRFSRRLGTFQTNTCAL